MQTSRLTPDIVIIGGGIAGLWTLSQLRQQGHSAVLLEKDALGSGQTIHSQGIIHGGLKYALAGRTGRDALALADLPALWRDALSGHGPIDLKDTAVVSDYLHLWSSGSPGARLAQLLGSKALACDIEKLSPGDYPPLFQSPNFRGTLYRIGEQVVDVSSLLATLAQQNAGHIFSIDWQHASLEVNQDKATLRLPGIKLQPRLLLLAAGAGNAGLLQSVGADAPAMQLRPLQQVMVHQPGLVPLFGHFIGTGLEPRFTITSHPTPAGNTVWYLGGELATGGAHSQPEELIRLARQELSAALPGWRCADTQWRTLKVDRAEVQRKDGGKPNNSFLSEVPGINNLMVSWPTKLVLAPQLANKVSSQLGGELSAPFDTSAMANLGQPGIARPAWETAFS